MTEENLELFIFRIKSFDTEIMAGVLGLSLPQTRNIKRGSSGISNTNALLLKKEFGLEPEGFAEIRKVYLEEKTKN